MNTLCSCHYYAPYGNPDFIRKAMIQIIFSETGPIDVYECPYDEFRVEYYATPSQQFLIQAKVTKHLPKIINIIGCNKDAIWEYLFMNALYVAQKPSNFSLRLMTG